MGRTPTLGVLVAIDLATKALAVALLPPRQPIHQDAALQLVLRWNRYGLGNWARTLSSDSTPEGQAVVGLGYVGLGFFLLSTRNARWSRAQRIVWATATFVVGCALGFLFLKLLGGLPLTMATVLARLGPTVLFTCLWWLARPGLWKITAMLLAAAGLGNLLCLLAPPHAVIDFIYSRPLAKILGHGVFNIADLYFDAALFCLMFIVGRFLLARLGFGSRPAA